MSEKNLNSQSDTQCGVHFFHFGIRESGDVIGQDRFGETLQIVTIYSTVVFKPLVYSYLYLCLYDFIVIGIDRRTNDCRESCINKHLAADNQKNAKIFRIVLRAFVDSIKFAAFHSFSHNGTWYESASIASTLSLSAWQFMYSISSASVTFRFTSALAGVNVRTTGPVGTS